MLAHVEYDNGYIIFGRLGGFLEVWRHASDCSDAERPTENIPDEPQLRVSAVAIEIYRSLNLRGHFIPWALIEMPAFGRVSRLVHPSLVMSSEERTFIWDVQTAHLNITIQDIQRPIGGAVLGRINYVELCEQYIVICGSKQLRIFSNSPRGDLLYHLPAFTHSYANSSVVLARPDQDEINDDTILIARNLVTRTFKLAEGHASRPVHFNFDDFVAGTFIIEMTGFPRSQTLLTAHVSPCQTILVAVLNFGRILIVSNLESVISGEISLEDAALEIDLNNSSLPPSLFSLLKYMNYLAVAEGRIGIATVRIACASEVLVATSDH